MAVDPAPQPQSAAEMRESSHSSSTLRLVRGELRSWLAEHWDPERSLVEWRRSLLATGWAAPTWPVEWCGRGLPSWADALVADELSRAGAVGAAVGSGMTLAAPTLLAHGSDDLKRRLEHAVNSPLEGPAASPAKREEFAQESRRRAFPYSGINLWRMVTGGRGKEADAMLHPAALRIGGAVIEPADAHEGNGGCA